MVSPVELVDRVFALAGDCGGMVGMKRLVDWLSAGPWSSYSDVSYGSVYTETGRASLASATVASWWALNPRVSVFAEGLAVGRVSGGGSGTAGNNVDGGATYLINDRFQLDVRVGRGLGSETSSERFVGVGLARRW